MCTNKHYLLNIYSKDLIYFNINLIPFLSYSYLRYLHYIEYKFLSVYYKLYKIVIGNIFANLHTALILEIKYTEL